MEISNKAALTAIKVMLLAVTAVGLIAGIYEPMMIKALIFILDVFLFSYVAAFAFFKKKM